MAHSQKFTTGGVAICWRPFYSSAFSTSTSLIKATNMPLRYWEAP